MDVTPPPTPRRRARVVTGLALVLVGALLVLAASTTVVVLGSASMQPWADPGALLVHRTVPVEQLAVDDVVTVTLADGSLVTHRIVELAPQDDGTATAVLRGDANPAPDAAVYALGTEVDRVVLAVPRLGGFLRVGLPALTAAIALLGLGGLVLRLSGPGRVGREVPAASVDGPADDPEVRVHATAPVAAADPATVDPRVEALLATVEQLEEDGLDPVVARDLVRVRVGELAGAGQVEASPAARDLDDPALFYLVALVDADADALALVRPRGTGRLAGSIAVGHWWLEARDRLTPATAAAVAPWTTRRG